MTQTNKNNKNNTYLKGFLRLTATAAATWPGEGEREAGAGEGARTCRGVAEIRACRSLFLAFSLCLITSAGLTHGAGDPTSPTGLMVAGQGGAGWGKQNCGVWLTKRNTSTKPSPYLSSSILWPSAHTHTHTHTSPPPEHKITDVKQKKQRTSKKIKKDTNRQPSFVTSIVPVTKF
ncbi:hypothetical protein E2C01_035865 [Portunus trituberculatus]|uniref:Uncharacterized protein n=1 Tax=Portunus trituberculatus TaxID=210409 RepID=A0A5B7FAV7_PORTR|nr:hypothetical protein [Portunus trituberculatus]